jgi:hypothetical protein
MNKFGDPGILWDKIWSVIDRTREINLQKKNLFNIASVNNIPPVVDSKGRVNKAKVILRYGL